MRKKQRLYDAIEAVIGRDLAWRAGRFLYLGARRELANDPATNGEYALIRWVLDAAGDVGQLAAGHRPAGAVLIDVGANVGDWTERALRDLHTREQHRQVPVYAFEPAPEQRARVESRLKDALVTGRLLLHSHAVGASPALSRFTVTGALSGTSSLTEGALTAGRQIDVQVVTLDDVSSRHGLTDIVLAKVDTEGNDFNVILGGAALLKEGRVRVLQFEYNWRWVGFGHCLKNVFQAIEETPYEFGRLTQEHIEIYHEWHPELEHYYETNYVLVRRDVLPRLPHRRVVFGRYETPATARGYRSSSG